MLTADALYTVFPLVEQLDANNAVLTAKAGTPLHHLVMATNASSNLACKLENGEVSIDTWGLENNTNIKVEGTDISRHDAAIRDFVGVAAKAVQNALTVARTMAQPRINDLFDMVTMRLKTATPSDVTRINIRTDDDCSVLFNPVFQKMIGKYENAPQVLPAMRLNYEPQAAQDIIGRLLTGIDSLDTDIVTWAGNIDPSTLRWMWESFFMFDSANGMQNGAFPDRLKMDNRFPLLVFLIANHLLVNEEVSEKQNIGLKELKSCLESYVEQAGLVLCRKLNSMNVSIKNGVLVRSIDGTCINVNTPVYNQWLENGGDNDVLFGMAVSDNKNYTVGSITENAEKYRKNWARYVAMTTSADSSRRFSFLLEQLSMCYENILAKPCADGRVLSAEMVAKEMKEFKSQLRQLSISDTVDLSMLCHRLVCRASFGNTPSELILTKMNEVAKDSPNIAPREAAAIATLWYIAKWVGEQMTVANA